MEHEPHGQEDNEVDIDELEIEVGHIDAEIMRLLERRRQVARQLASKHRELGEPAHPYSEQLQERERWRALSMGSAVITIIQRHSRDTR